MESAKLSSENIALLTDLRRELHRHPEVSHKENDTAERLVEWSKTNLPSFEVKSIEGNHGVFFLFDSGKKGKHLVFRAELDALPIEEDNTDLNYRSKNNGVGHLCGHDGHMTMVCGVGLMIENEPPKSGRVTLLFQPAEETGEGAALVRKSDAFKDLNPDVIYALHNLPGHPIGQVMLKSDSMCLASTGLWIRLRGKTSHAAEPFAGNSPLRVFSPLINGLQFEKKDPIRISTLVHVQLGKPSFGTTPGNMDIALTIRAETDEQLDALIEDVIESFREKAELFDIRMKTERTEHFAAVTNHEEAVENIVQAARKKDLKIKEMEVPTLWSEDVGELMQGIKGALFCLGSGEDTPVLHHPTYNFPDELIPIGSEMFYEILLKETEST